MLATCPGRLECYSYIPTAFSSMMFWALVLAADILMGLTDDEKNLRRNEMMGNDCVGGWEKAKEGWCFIMLISES